MKSRRLNQRTKPSQTGTGDQSDLVSSRESDLRTRGCRSLAKVVAGIPCFNTERFVGDVVSKAKKYVSQVIVINDGSHDSTAEVAKGAGALVIIHRINKGYGESIKSCFDWTKANDADILVTLDGDGQHNPDELLQVLTPILDGKADLVIGSRFLKSSQPKGSALISSQSRAMIQYSEPSILDSQLLPIDYQLPIIDSSLGTMPRYRKFGINVITFLYNLGSKTKVSDAQSGFRAYSREVLETISPTEKGMGVSVEVIIKARESGFRIQEVPISCSYHLKSSNLNPLNHGLGVSFTVVKLRLKNLLCRLIKGEKS